MMDVRSEVIKTLKFSNRSTTARPHFRNLDSYSTPEKFKRNRGPLWEICKNSRKTTIKGILKIILKILVVNHRFFKVKRL